MKNLLVELGTEELPATALTKLSDAFAAEFTQGLTKAGLHFAKIESFATPRRLALIIHQLDEKQPDSEQDRKGPVAQTAFDANGKPSAACLGFAKSVGAEPEQLKEKEGYLYYTVKTPGKTIYNLVPQILTHAIDKLPIPKRMRWGSHQAQFSRPVHWLVLLYGNEIIPATILELNADRLTYGHRFHHPQAITLQAPEEYENKLAKACVIADFTKRRDSIRQQIDAQAKAAQGYAIIEPDLLDEVTGLVEWPVAITANFNPRFLAVPAQSLITAMQHHQKSFALLDNKQQLIPSFITISNIESKQPDRVRHGNERVMHARLSDAEFFYQTDLKTPLAQHADKLKTVIFQADLGSLWDKTQRLQTLMTALATQCDIPLALANRAAFLAKTDLLTTMVGEFPELQGIMGYYYAKHAGEDNAVALALQEQYLPRFANDELPTSTLGSLLAIADRIDTIVGIFGIDKAPSGEKDPFGLRRAALGIVRIMIDNQLGIDLSQLIELSISSYNNPFKNPHVLEQSFDFIVERLRRMLLEQGVSADILAAVLANKPTQPLDFALRVAAIQRFKDLPDAQALAAANKRVSRLLQKENEFNAHHVINTALLLENAEKQLAALLLTKQQQVAPLYRQHDYQSALAELAELRPAVDAFFDQVLVMDDNIAVRNNRLALLTQLRSLFLEVADISLLQ